MGAGVGSAVGFLEERDEMTAWSGSAVLVSGGEIDSIPKPVMVND